ncbi:hypothetical protein LOY37_18505 [Pseudomonas sp. B21-012]|uniref:hypothetical protein n=1 Tax=Pseudomonas TaxID=286 RepID=UPI00215F1895|nr:MULTISPECIES: hypothetical protein [unclassified Pseudomonas]UVL60071.1 hypothetical protein LOY54_18755 [Pseudomonas sp. B21-032]UVM54341.1 hypothetical protein LOY37_18505 [Pseudomonas sp. B21-012]
MTVWVVVSILALILSPLAWLRPSRKQSGQMALRMEARRMGLAMQLAPQEWPHWLPKEPPSPCAQYLRPRRQGRSDSWSYWQTTPGVWLNQWREPCTDAVHAGQLARLPESVYKVEAGPQMVALYWGERGETAVLQDIAEVLKALA